MVRVLSSPVLERALYHLWKAPYDDKAVFRRKWNVWFYLNCWQEAELRDAPVGTAILEIHLLLVLKTGLYHNSEDEEAAVKIS